MLAGSARVRAEDLHWSDGEDCDEKYLVKHWDVANRNDEDESLDSFQINEKSDKEQTSLIGIDRLADHQRSKYNGYIKVDKKIRANPLPSKNVNILSPEKFYYPTVPSDVKHILGDTVLLRIWKEFVKNGTDESELVLVTHARTIGATMQASNDDLPFDKLKILRDMESEDYIEFSTLTAELAKHYKPTERLNTSKPSTALCHICCAIGACRHRGSTTTPGTTRPSTSKSVPVAAPTLHNEESKDSESVAEPQIPDDSSSVFSEMKYVNSEDHRLSIIFSQIKHSLDGKIRIKHIHEVMERLFIPYDKNKLPKSFWTNHGEMYIKSTDQLKQLIHQIRTDLDDVVDPLAAMFKYELPQWLREEFKASEIMLYEHHFALIDVDNGGSIDVDELQALITNFGSKISREDAQAMLDEYDMDGGGTIDFVEFMVLIYKIQRGTIDLSSSDLARALIEAKSQLKIFEEIEEVSRDPPQYCTVAHFGGTPVACNFHIEGPVGTPYEGTTMTLQMVFHDGYPFRQPDIQFQGRVMSLHVLPQLSGDARLIHIKEIWTAEWSMHKLLVHTVDVLTNPEPDLLPDTFYHIYKSWESKWETKCAEHKRELKYEIAQETLMEAALTATAAEEQGAQDKTPTPSAPTSARASLLRADSKGTPLPSRPGTSSGTVAGSGAGAGIAGGISAGSGPSTPVGPHRTVQQAPCAYSRPPSGVPVSGRADSKGGFGGAAGAGPAGGAATPPTHLHADSKAGSRRPSNAISDSKTGSARGTAADAKGDHKDDPKGENKDLPALAEATPVAPKKLIIPTAAEVENAELSEELWEEKKHNLARTVSMDDLSDSVTRQCIVKLSRIERMHLGTMLLYLTDQQSYFKTVAAFMKTHAKSVPAETED